MCSVSLKHRAYPGAIKVKTEVVMFGKRSDGKQAVNIDPIMRITGTIMQHRYDTMINYLLEADCAGIDNFIEAEREKGESFSYMHVVVAAIVRTLAERPQLNRFIMNTRVFDRNKICISMTIKKFLRDDADEAVIKMEFDGSENIYGIKELLDNAVRENQKSDAGNGTEKTARMLLHCPPFLLKLIMKTAMFLDRHGMLPKKLIRVSPFHSSCYFTNLKSISTGYVYHHLYDFGTVGMFVALGKEVIKPVSDIQTDGIRNAKILQLGITLDERICDGLYFAKSLKIIKSHLTDPGNLRYDFAVEKPLTKKEQRRARRKQR